MTTPTAGPRVVPFGTGRVRLLYVVNDSSSFVSRRLPLAKAALRAGFDVHVASPAYSLARATEGESSFHDSSPADAIDTIKGSGLTHHELRVTRRGTNPIAEVMVVADLLRLYRRLRPDVVHHITIKPILYGTLAARLAGVPGIVNSFVGLGYLFMSEGLLGALQRNGVRRAYGLLAARSNIRSVFQNPDDLATLCRPSGRAASLATLIRGSGVDLDRFRAAVEPDGEPVVILAARMLWDKGVREFAEAAHALKSRGIAARFVLVGGLDAGNPSCVPAEQLREWASLGAVEWWGQRSDLPDILASCAIVCLPSYGEGVPRILLEAAASGKPIVATDVSGCREVVRDRENGILVPARDAVGLADALRRLLESREERARMGVRGREIAEAEFGLEGVIRQTLDVYGNLTGNAAAPTSRSGSQPGAWMRHTQDVAQGSAETSP